MSLKNKFPLRSLTTGTLVLWVTLLLVCQTVAGVQTQTPARSVETLPPEVILRIDNAVRDQMEQQSLIGVAIGVIQNGQVVYTQGYGFENRENKIPMSTHSMIRWASVSKTLTAVVAAQLAAEGKLDLQANVCELVPEFPHHDAGITARDLLCHQSGIVHYSNGPVIRTKTRYEVEHPFQDVVTALDVFKESPLLFPPREKYSYSTHAYILLSAATQRAENKPFADQVRDRIVQPLGLTSLQPDYQWIEIPHRAIGYRKLGNILLLSSNTDVSWKLGGGGFISNVEDMARYAAALMDNKIMTPEMKSQFWVPQKTSDGSETNMGLGFLVDGADRSLRIFHNGSQEKSKTRLVIYPNRLEGIVVMSNCENADPGRITTAILQSITAEKKAIEK